MYTDFRDFETFEDKIDRFTRIILGERDDLLKIIKSNKELLAFKNKQLLALKITNKELRNKLNKEKVCGCKEDERSNK